MDINGLDDFTLEIIFGAMPFTQLISLRAVSHRWREIIDAIFARNSECDFFAHDIHFPNFARNIVIARLMRGVYNWVTYDKDSTSLREMANLVGIPLIIMFTDYRKIRLYEPPILQEIARKFVGNVHETACIFNAVGMNSRANSYLPMDSMIYICHYLRFLDREYRVTFAMYVHEACHNIWHDSNNVNPISRKCIRYLTTDGLIVSWMDWHANALYYAYCARYGKKFSDRFRTMIRAKSCEDISYFANHVVELYHESRCNEYFAQLVRIAYERATHNRELPSDDIYWHDGKLVPWYLIAYGYSNFAQELDNTIIHETFDCDIDMEQTAKYVTIFTINARKSAKIRGISVAQSCREFASYFSEEQLANGFAAICRGTDISTYGAEIVNIHHFVEPWQIIDAFAARFGVWRISREIVELPRNARTFQQKEHATQCLRYIRQCIA